LVSAPGIPVGTRLSTVRGAVGGGSSVPLGALADTAGVATVATFAVGTNLVRLVGLLAPLGGSSTAGGGITGIVSVVVLSPLVIIGLDSSGVALVVVRLCRDLVEGFSPS